MFDGLWADARHAARQLAKRPAFALAAALTLALGIGASTAVFSVVHAVILSELPYPEPDRLFMVWQRERGQPTNLGYPTIADLRDRSKSFDALAALAYWNPTLSSDGEPEAVQGMSVNADFFRVLGVQPMLGRTFAAEEDVPDGPPVAILSYGLWQRRFGGDASIVGKPVTISGRARTVIGVMPREFQSILTHEGLPADIWRPLGYRGEEAPSCRGCQHLRAVARLVPGVAPQAAEAEVDGVLKGVARERPNDYPPDTGAALESLDRSFSADVRQPLLLLFGAVLCVLLAACANVASLQLARAFGRRQELGVRTALGAPFGHIVRQLMVESLLLGALGGALGIGVAQVGTRALLAAVPVNLPRIEQVSVDWRVLAFAVFATFVAVLLSGVGPALLSARRSLAERLSAGSRVSTSLDQHRLRRGLVVADVALAMILLAGAALMTRSMSRLLSVDPGFASEGVLTFNASVFGPRYGGDDGDARTRETFEAILTRIRALPGVVAAGAVNQLPLGGDSDMSGVRAQDHPPANPADAPGAYRYGVMPGYFETMKIPLLRGRLLSEADGVGAEKVALVSDRFARAMWPGEDPLGKFVQVGAASYPYRRVVGVVGDVRHRGLDEPPRMQVYTTEAQWVFADSTLIVVIRTAGEPSALIPAARDAIRAASASVRVSRFASLESVVASSAAPRRFVTSVLAGFAGASALLAALGVYGLMAFIVAQRTGEVGVRLALGARPSDIRRLVLAQGARVVGAGAAIGAASTLALSRLLAGMLYGVEPRDPVSLVVAAGALMGVALLATDISARRAARVNPMVALRSE